ncbi:hypothetical protein ZIOFF_041402 [Zingiber officinale]|uniref:Uncharacterized protein n=1 Tax=Zingiber officinale TaxID=94328 RepID=A0A8J5L5A6_ZINOF|nr:hypothetical protein ZIOFF_041402 [Zingiber officinale]
MHGHGIMPVKSSCSALSSSGTSDASLHVSKMSRSYKLRPRRLSHARSLSREVGRWKSSKHTVKTYMNHFPRISPSPEPVDDFSSIYGASKRMVPQGPNPLHN